MEKDNIYPLSEEIIGKRIISNKFLQIVILIPLGENLDEFQKIRWLIDENSTEQIFHVLVVSGDRNPALIYWPRDLNWATLLLLANYDKNLNQPSISLCTTYLNVIFHKTYQRRLNLFLISADQYTAAWESITQSFAPGGKYHAVDSRIMDPGLSILFRFRNDAKGFSVYARRLSRVLQDLKDDSSLESYIKISLAGYSGKIDQITSEAVSKVEKIVSNEPDQSVRIPLRENVFLRNEEPFLQRILNNHYLEAIIFIDADNQPREFHKIKWLVDQNAKGRNYHIIMASGHNTSVLQLWPKDVAWTTWVKSLTHRENAADKMIMVLSIYFTLKHKNKLTMFVVSHDHFIFDWEDVLRATFPERKFYAVDPISVDLGLFILYRFKDNSEYFSASARKIVKILQDRYKSSPFSRDEILLNARIQDSLVGCFDDVKHITPHSIIVLDECFYSEKNNHSSDLEII